MNIKDAYARYEIMPNLEEHMLRVTGVGYLVAESWTGSSIDSELVVKTGLLHDMGNIVKFDLSEETANKFMVKNVKYWRKVQEKYIQKYGTAADEATYAILKEMNLVSALEIIEEETKMYGSGWESKNLRPESVVLMYADMRVIPSGVTSIEQRSRDLSNRYGRELDYYDFLRDLEIYLQGKTKIDIRKIDEKMMKSYFPKFLSVTI